MGLALLSAKGGVDPMCGQLQCSLQGTMQGLETQMISLG